MVSNLPTSPSNMNTSHSILNTSFLKPHTSSRFDYSFESTINTSLPFSKTILFRLFSIGSKV